MQSHLYIALSAQRALLDRLESVAGNVANVSTPGYRAEMISFEEVLSRSQDPASFVSEGRTFLSTASGAMEKTGNPFDIAVSGSAWLGVATPNGVSYTRDGRFAPNSDGALVSVKGYPLVDVGGSPIQIDPSGPPPEIGRDGTITQGDRTLGSIGLFRLQPDAILQRTEFGTVAADRPAEPELDFTAAGIQQGYIEKSNADPIFEMTRLITLQRNFDSISNAIVDVEENLIDAVRTLGS
ncbi:MAG: flagellar basal-body rod protein FlgF [Hyphomicrobium sp.]|nr:flagellar basal-body rod protein FlgF [Hyphomicrobium sp.]